MHMVPEDTGSGRARGAPTHRPIKHGRNGCTCVRVYRCWRHDVSNASRVS